MNLSPIAPTARAIRVRRLYETFTNEEKTLAENVYQGWYKSTPQVAAWSSPIAVKYYGGKWEIFQKGDLVGLVDDDLVEEVFDLRYIFGNWN
jgi:hypothetical protein